MTGMLKKLVSKKKRRYYEGGFDLDLSYIKPNIVAMGFPSEKIEGVYRNHIDEILRFLETKHRDHYKVYNLCSERQYDPSKFNNRVANYPFDDHNAPPFQLMKPFCEDMVEFLGADEDNVAIVHCKAGKGRTGVMICAYLLHKRFFKSCKDAMEYYGDARTSNKKGVTIPSQRRYVYYYGHYFRQKLHYEPKTLLITGFVMETIPNLTNGTCSPFFHVWQSDVKIYASKAEENPKKGGARVTFILPQPLPVCSDIKVQFYNKDTFKKELMFQFWFNTFFVSGQTPKPLESEPSMDTKEGEFQLSSSGTHVKMKYFELHKEDLDKANKDKKNRIFSPNFKLKVLFEVPDMKVPIYHDADDHIDNNHLMVPGTTMVPGTPTGTIDRRKRYVEPRQSSPRLSPSLATATISHSISSSSLASYLDKNGEYNLSESSDEESEWNDKMQPQDVV